MSGCSGHGTDAQQRAEEQLRAIGRSLELYAKENGRKYPWVASVEELAPVLVPKYIGAISARDPWGNRLYFFCWQEDQVRDGCDHFRLASAGRDGVMEHEGLRDYKDGEIEGEGGDLVFAGALGERGAMIRRPRGTAP